MYIDTGNLFRKFKYFLLNIKFAGNLGYVDFLHIVNLLIKQILSCIIISHYGFAGPNNKIDKCIARPTNNEEISHL